jgi:hypothetical protein
LGWFVQDVECIAKLNPKEDPVQLVQKMTEVEKEGLSTGIIILIAVLGSILILLLVGFLIWTCCRKPKNLTKVV